MKKRVKPVRESLIDIIKIFSIRNKGVHHMCLIRLLIIVLFNKDICYMN